MFKNHVVGGSVGIFSVSLYLKIDICVRCLSFSFQSLKSSSENLNGNHADSHQTNHSRSGFVASLLNENRKKTSRDIQCTTRFFSDSRVAYCWKKSCYSNQLRLIVYPIISRSFIQLRRKKPRCVTRESYNKDESHKRDGEILLYHRKSWKNPVPVPSKKWPQDQKQQK